MSPQFDRKFPAAVLLSGIVGAFVWVVALRLIGGVSSSEIASAVSAGVVGAGVATMVVLTWDPASKAELEQLGDTARRDALTGLYNRSELFRLLAEAIEDAQNNDQVLGVLFLDLDRFKLVNDSMGHEAGDELLRIVAKRLRATIRGTDTVARLGGDEFVVLCRDLVSPDAAVVIAEQILGRFDDPVSLGGLDHRVGTSIGIAVRVPGDERNADDLVRDADAAMYRAKETKSGIEVFDDAHRMRQANRLDTERDLKLAVERGELTVHYQPILDISARRLYGFEALVRWNHPQRGELNPSEFLAIAGQAGLIGWIGDFVLRETCAQAAIWNRYSVGARTIKMCVNLSEPQLVDPNLARRIEEVLRVSGLPAQQLVLEIAEDLIVDHADGLASLRELKALGVEVSIDDFGTGQSPLGYVKDLDSVSTLKIDERFVRELRSGAANRAIIEAVVAMATALDVRVVAEGVEDEDELETLERMGVSLMQGYLFSAPMSAAAVDPRIWFPGSPSPATVGAPSAAAEPVAEADPSPAR